MKQKLATLCCLAALSSPFNTTLANTELPDLGDSASSYVSLQQEHALGPSLVTPTAQSDIDH